MATATQLAILRSFCGSDVGADGDPFDLIDVDARLADCGGSAHTVALQILRQRRADLVMGGKQDVDGDFSIDPTESIKALDRDITTLEGIVGNEAGTGTATTSLLVRRTGR